MQSRRQTRSSGIKVVPRRNRCASGFALVEALIALALLVIALIPALATMRSQLSAANRMRADVEVARRDANAAADFLAHPFAAGNVEVERIGSNFLWRAAGRCVISTNEAPL